MAEVPLLPLAQGRTNITDTYTLTEVSCYDVISYHLLLKVGGWDLSGINVFPWNLLE